MSHSNEHLIFWGDCNCCFILLWKPYTACLWFSYCKIQLLWHIWVTSVSLHHFHILMKEKLFILKGKVWPLSRFQSTVAYHPALACILPCMDHIPYNVSSTNLHCCSFARVRLWMQSNDILTGTNPCNVPSFECTIKWAPYSFHVEHVFTHNVYTVGITLSTCGNT